MKHLPFPEDAGDRIITKQCKKAGWAATEERWLEAVACYRECRGDPWRILPAKFNNSEAKALYELYDTQGYSGPINRIRRPKKPFKSCPMCGSLASRSLDHALPRKHFPEFSIVRENLVPACHACNSGEKGTTYRGSSERQRFIHPYYDEWASEALWRIEFAPDLDVLQFWPAALPNLQPEQVCIVDFHVKTLLRKEWRDAVRRDWGALPASLHLRLRKITRRNVQAELNTRLREAVDWYGVNSWNAGFFRGLIADPLVAPKLIERISALPIETD